MDSVDIQQERMERAWVLNNVQEDKKNGGNRVLRSKSKKKV